LKMCVSFKSAVNGAIATEMMAILRSRRPPKSVRDIRCLASCGRS